MMRKTKLIGYLKVTTLSSIIFSEERSWEEEVQDALELSGSDAADGTQPHSHS